MSTLLEVRRRMPRTNPNCTADRHGTAAAYTQAGCRCPEGREERRIREKRRRHGYDGGHTSVSGLGSARRVQALAVLGWTFEQIGARFPKPVSSRAIQKLAYQGDKRVHVATANRIDVIYRELSSRQGSSPITRARAKARGWLPPLAWDNIDDPDEEPRLGGEGSDLVDKVAIERALGGDRIRLTPAERHHAIHVAVARGVPATKAGRALGLSGSTSRHYASTPPPAAEVAA
ncbi:hypothetical protein [Catenuloplanes indicus]|uniref:Uncharacterized protein n=1 Tax=Catenuloplanes indicus TaxID=137267 RepID=A0AAE3W817_9ACTN|nr:hypothetical protein [Catenuloplanes indicus]MDQ0371558.1 hypothetical protein [Catenuloplanes indicus]